MSNGREIILVYDKECPACHYYCHMLHINDSLGQLQLINAREASTMMDDITAHGWDIDQGMVLKAGHNLYYGADAIHMLALLGSRHGFVNRLNYWCFCSPRRSKILYPLLRFLRNRLLKIRKVRKINNLHQSNNSHF